MSPSISIGILAYNESASIQKTLESLFEQSLINDFRLCENVELVVVPNGCTDNTADLCRHLLDKLVSHSPHPRLSWKVCEVAQPGKSNAWNLYVHQFSGSEAQSLFLMDADIQFLGSHTLWNMLKILEENADAWIATDLPVKDIDFKNKKNLMERLSAQTAGSDIHDICGQLYCGRADILRKIWLPLDLIVEDGFLRAMILTDRFTSPENLDRIRRASDASHTFEAYTTVSSLIKHEKGIVVGIVINALIYHYLWANCNSQQDAGSLIKFNNEQNPLWVRGLIQQTRDQQGWWLIPRSMLSRRFRRLRYSTPLKAALKLPFTGLASLVDLMVFFQANIEIHKRGGVGYWWN
ncbi:MAG: glycosyltransferase family 2 protein [Cyanophyceae cyanobacterium]